MVVFDMISVPRNPGFGAVRGGFLVVIPSASFYWMNLGLLLLGARHAFHHRLSPNENGAPRRMPRWSFTYAVASYAARFRRQ